MMGKCLLAGLETSSSILIKSRASFKSSALTFQYFLWIKWDKMKTTNQKKKNPMLFISGPCSHLIDVVILYYHQISERSVMCKMCYGCRSNRRVCALGFMFSPLIPFASTCEYFDALRCPHVFWWWWRNSKKSLNPKCTLIASRGFHWNTYCCRIFYFIFDKGFA